MSQPCQIIKILLNCTIKSDLIKIKEEKKKRNRITREISKFNEIEN